ncbi:MAG: UTP--glucose-1-phosphate uridylyltransferase GalU [Deltaproteobacteria bacterium]|nr:UTP--glucose-1-phosphate uridylyltransferase GalU [Thermodesulfobacteriota bacterium]MDP2799895.1 UTP--glucose-1-phosphate uridylyltransferase GalU [Deltaproteobacteria bacterium]
MRIRKAVIPVAGLGTRFLPATKAIPKEMLTIVDRPTIQYIVEEVVASGIEQVIMVTGSGKSAIEDHFDYSYELETILEQRKKWTLLEEVKKISNLIEITSVRQKRPLGLGHAILCTKDLVGNEPFVVVLGDDLVDASIPCTQQLLNVFNEFHRPIVAVYPVSKEEIHNYGIVEGEEIKEQTYRVTKMMEKPAPETTDSNLAIIGRYILTPDIFTILENTPTGHGGEIQLTDALMELARQNQIYAYRFAGRRYDAGDKFGYIQATLAYALKHPEIGPRVREYLQKELCLG